MKVLFVLGIFAVGAYAVPQFGLGIPKAPAPLPVTPPSALPNLQGALEWTKKIEDLVTLTRTALTDMGDIAVSDNPEAGAKIVTKLQNEITKAAQILADFTTKTATGARRRRRDINSNGEEAYNGVGVVLVNSNDNTQPEKSELSPEAQEKMDDRHEKAVNDCKAEVCKSHSEKLKKAKAARDKKKGK